MNHVSVHRHRIGLDTASICAQVSHRLVRDESEPLAEVGVGPHNQPRELVASDASTPESRVCGPVPFWF
jgi:hypothetical protein